MKSYFSLNLLLPLIAFLFTGQALHSQVIGSRGISSEGIGKIDALMKKMTLEEKIGQLNLVASGWDITGPRMENDGQKLIREGKTGAILNAYTVDYVRELQRMAVEESRLGIPLLFGYDVIHGYKTSFPIPLAQASSWDLAAIEQSERISAIEASAVGLNWVFAPMVDLARDPRWGRVMEGTGEDTWLASRIAEARVRGFQGQDLSANNTMLACSKHFAAYGAPQGGRDYHTVDMSQLSLFEWYLPPYQACVDAGVGSVMTSFNEIAGTPSTSNKWLLSDLLKHEWGFKGFVVTDWTSINELVPHGVAIDNKDAARLALNAGVDMDLAGGTLLNHTAALLKENKVSLSRIDDAVRKILEAKERLGLFDDPYRYCDKKREQSMIMTPEHLSFARKMVSASCVLLKNDRQILPVPENVRRIAVIGPLGNSKKDMPGSWSAAGRPEQCVTLFEGVQQHVNKNIDVVFEMGCNPNDKDGSSIDAAVKVAMSADYIILALGETAEMSGEAASRAHIDLPGLQNELADAIVKTGKPVAVVLFNGRPLAISKLNTLPVAILETWFGGTQAGNGIADVLFGDVNPSGKLTMTFPRNEGQIPIFYNSKNTGRPLNAKSPDTNYVSKYLDCTNEPLFPFGYGLSYTSFGYSDLVAGVDGDTIRIAVRVENTGNFDGVEVVQLYVRDLVASVTRPVKELKGFRKVMIRKGAKTIVSFSLTRSDLAFYHQDLKKYFEPGEFEVFVGANSSGTISTSITVP